MAGHKDQLAKHSSQKGLTIWHGMRVREAIQFLGRGPALHWSRLNRIVGLPGFACYNSVFSIVENLLYGRQIRQTELTAPPIFVLGMWRSGTTLLHSLLTRDPQHTSPTMYRTLFPWHFLTTEKVVSNATGWLIPKSRPMDNVPMSWDAPQEDDVALCIMTLLSPYMLMAKPQDLDAHWKYLDLKRLSDAELQNWKNSLNLLLKKITIRDQKRIVLKSPPHTFRIPLLRDMFPDAKFVYIHRNPYNVFRSAVHLRKTAVAENCLGLPQNKNIERDMLDTCKFAYECYSRDRQLIPEGNLHEVRFENLEVDPIGEMEKVYDGLNLTGFDVLAEILRPELAELRRYKKNRFKNDPEWMGTVYDELRDEFEQNGYPSPFEELEASAA